MGVCDFDKRGDQVIYTLFSACLICNRKLFTIKVAFFNNNRVEEDFVWLLYEQSSSTGEVDEQLPIFDMVINSNFLQDQFLNKARMSH